MYIKVLWQRYIFFLRYASKMVSFARFIVKIIDFLYIPFRKILPEQLFRYAVCGGGNMFLDWVLYFFVYNFVIGHQLVYIPLPFSFLSGQFLCMTPHILALCIVFPITLLTGFWLNKYVTFTSSALHGARQLIRYMAVVAVNLAINYFGLKLCVEVVGWYPTPSKMFITLVTVAVSYFGQKYFSFR